MSANISCPVSDIKINENRVRLNAFFVLLSALAYILAPDWEIPAFLETALGFCAGCHVYILTRKFLPAPDVE